MNQTLIIIRREFLNRIRKKSFIILTILTPFIVAALIFVPLLLSMIKSDEAKEIAVMDKTGKYASALVNSEEYKFTECLPMPAKTLLDSTEYDAVLEIWGDLVKSPNSITIYSYKEVPASLSRIVENTLTDKIRYEKIKNYAIPELKDIMNDYNKKVSISTMKLNEDGSMNKSNTGIAMGIGFILTFVIYMFVLLYGGMVLQSVTEEKTNRIVEIMISSVRPFQLMIGKVIGIGLVGIFQLAIWGVMLFILTGAISIFIGAEISPEITSAMGAAPAVEMNEFTSFMSALDSINFTTIGITFLLNFIGGYLIYAAMFAAIGAAVNEQEDSQQFMTPIMLLIIFALYAALYSAENPEGPLALWCSMIPFTAPIVSMIRVALDIPLWQTIVSLVILYATAILFIWMAGKIYRIGILMYGKKPSFKEIMKWMTYK